MHAKLSTQTREAVSGGSLTLIELPVVRKRERIAFTLVELLVVVAIIAILAGLLSPALKKARDQARQIQCMSNLRNFGLATSAYLQDNNEYFPAGWDGTATWYDRLRPFLPGQLQGNQKSGKAPIFFCPSTTQQLLDTFYTNYGLCCGFGQFTATRFTEVRKPAELFLITDAHTTYRGVDWTRLDYRHQRGVVMLYADFHVSWIGEDNIPGGAYVFPWTIN